MANILPQATFKEWSKDPKTAIAIFCASVAMAFFSWGTYTSNARVNDCKETTNYLREQLVRANEEKVELAKENRRQSLLNEETILLMDSILHKEVLRK